MTPQTMNDILEVCAPTLSEKDMMDLGEMLAKKIPPKAMAADAVMKCRGMVALDGSIRGAVRRQYSNGALSVTDKLALDARLSPAERRARARPLTVEQSAEVKRMFPHMKTDTH